MPWIIGVSVAVIALCWACIIRSAHEDAWAERQKHPPDCDGCREVSEDD